VWLGPGRGIWVMGAVDSQRIAKSTEIAIPQSWTGSLAPAGIKMAHEYNRDTF